MVSFNLIVLQSSLLRLVVTFLMFLALSPIFSFKICLHLILLFITFYLIFHFFLFLQLYT